MSESAISQSMNDRSPRRSSSGSRRRRVIRLVALGILIFLLWRGAEYLLVADHYKPAVESAIADATGLSVSIGKLHLRLFPSPRVMADAVVIGSGDFQVSVDRAKASLRVRPLLHREIDVPAVTLSGMKVTVPQDLGELSERVKALSSARGAKPDAVQTGSHFTVNIHQVVAQEMTLHLGETTEPYLTCNVDAQDVLSDNVGVHLDGALPGLGNALLAAELSIAPKSGPAFRGTADLNGIALKRLVDYAWLPDTQLTLRANIEAQNPSKITIDVAGSGERCAFPLFNGTFTAAAWWDQGALTVNDLHWQSPGVSLQADATREATGSIACHVREATADESALALLFAVQPSLGFTLAPHEGASARVADFVAGVTASGELRFVKGEAAFEGIDLTLADGTKALTDLHGRFTVDEGTLRLDPLAADGLTLAGAITPDLRTGHVAFDLAGKAALTRPRLAIAIPSSPITDIDGAVTFHHVTGTFVPGQGIPTDLSVDSELKSDHLAFVLPPLSHPEVFTNLSGAVAFKEGRFVIDKLAGDGVSVSGSVTPDWRTGTVALDLTGQMTLDRERLAPLMPVDDFSQIGGTVRFKGIRATFERGKDTPPDLRIEGRLDNGSVGLGLTSYEDTFSGVSGDFLAESDGIRMNVEGQSLRMGAIQADGRYAFAKRLWEGTVSCDAQQVGEALIGKTAWSAALSAFGASTFAASLAIPQTEQDAIRITMKRQADPALEALVSVERQGKGRALGAIQVTATVPLDAVKTLIPPAVSADGNAQVTVDRATAEQTFRALVDLTTCSIRAGQYIQKKPGAALTVEVAGRAGEGGWEAQTIDVAYAGAKVSLRMEGGSVHADSLDLDLEPFSGLLTEGASMRGRVRGAFATSPLKADLAFDHTGLTLSPQLGIESITGQVAYADGHLTCNELAVRGANSDCTITAGPKGGRWQGRVSGQAFDLNAALAMLDAAKAFQHGPEEAVTPEAAFAGDFAVDIQSVFYRRARFENVRANVQIEKGVVHVRDISAQPYSGAVHGSVDVRPSKPSVPGQVELDLALDGIDARAIDEVLFEEPRGFSGLVSANAKLRIPTKENPPPVNGTSGTVEFAAKDGSFGKLGLATKLLTVLKTTEVVRLRLPSFKNEGLTYGTCVGSFEMKDGVLAIRAWKLTSPSFAMEAEGGVDFPNQNTDLHVRVNFLESVTGIVQHVPLVGSAVSMAAGVTDLFLHVDGSPYDPRVRVDPARRIENATKKAGGAAADLIGGVLRKFGLRP